MKVGLSCIITPREWSFAETLQKAKAASYEALEVVCTDQGDITLDTPKDKLLALADQAREQGIDLVSLCPQIGGKSFNIMLNDAIARKENTATAMRLLQLTADLGIGTMLFVPGVIDSDTYYDDAYRNSLSVLKWELAPFAEDIGVTIAIEYVWNKFLLSPMEFAEYVDEVESSNVGLFFDTGNMVVFGFPEQWVKINSYRVKMVHFKDFKRDGWGWPPLLEGDVDFPAVMRELRAIEYDDAVLSEVPPGVASLEDTSAAMRKILEM